MRTNIERAINELILSSQDVTLANTLPAYLREAGFKKMSPDALTAFEHALEKHPTRTDESRAVFVQGISSIIAEYWGSAYIALGDSPCGHCTTPTCRRFNFRTEANLKGYGHAHPEEAKRQTPERREFLWYDDPEGFIDIGDLVVKSKKKGRRVRTKGNVVNARFDPSAPTTSAVML